MRKELLSTICCPSCSAKDFQLSIHEENNQEIREGQVSCQKCKHQFNISKGVVNLLPNPDQTIQSEQRGWIEMLGKTSDELVDVMLQLPHFKDDIWVTTSENFDQIIEQIDFTDKSVLDIGAGRCWSTRHMVLAGASYAVALDILTTKYIGLETADIFLDHDSIYFERILGDMNDLPLQANQFDIVFMTGTLHHSSTPAQVMQEVARCLKPNGQAVIINEPIRGIFRSKDLSWCSEIAHGINENVYTIHEYINATQTANLNPLLFFPRSIARGLEQHNSGVRQEMGTIGYYLSSLLWRTQWGRKALQGNLLPVILNLASLPLVMIASDDS